MSDDEKREVPENGNGHDPDGDDDLLQSCLEKMAELAADARENDHLTDEIRMAMLNQFVVAANVQQAVDEVISVALRLRDLFDKLDGFANQIPQAAAAGMGFGAAGLGTPPSVEQVDGESPVGGFPGFAPQPSGPDENGASWLSEVLGQEEEPPAGIPIGKKALAVEIDCADFQPCGEEHVTLFRQCQAEGWDLERLNAELVKCKRPATARISTDPAKHP